MIHVTEAQRYRVETLLRRRDLPPRQRERLEMVKAASLGQEVAAIAQWSGRSARTVRHWLQRFADGGPAALVDAPRSGRPVQANGAYLQALDAALAQPPTAVGLPYDVWTSRRLSAYLAQQTGVRIAPSWLRTLLGRQDLVCGRPKHALGHLQDPAEAAAFEAAMAEVGGKNGGRAGPVRAAPPG